MWNTKSLLAHCIGQPGGFFVAVPPLTGRATASAHIGKPHQQTEEKWT